MIVKKSYKVMLLPNNKQKTKMFLYAGATRYAYNWVIDKEKESYENKNGFISDYELRKQFTQFKKQDENQWLYGISNDVTKQAIKDACNAYKMFFEKKSAIPKYKSKKKSKPSFYQDCVKIKFTETYVKLEGIANNRKSNRQKLNWVRLSEKGRIPIDAKYMNPRISFDGINWWISVTVEFEDSFKEIPKNDGIGIDLGIKDLAICSDGNIYKNINKTDKIRKIEKRKKRLQRKVSRKYQINKKGQKYCKTHNIVKNETAILKLNHRLTNIRKDYLHQTTTSIINREPRFICIEDLNVSGMVKNRKLSKAIQQQSFYEFHRQLSYKCKNNNIQLILADRFFPSSKMCSCCGNIKDDLKLSDRVYKCDCGNIIDRDFNAAINLKMYGERIAS